MTRLLFKFYGPRTQFMATFGPKINRWHVLQGNNWLCHTKIILSGQQQEQERNKNEYFCGGIFFVLQNFRAKMSLFFPLNWLIIQLNYWLPLKHFPRFILSSHNLIHLEWWEKLSIIIWRQKIWNIRECRGRIKNLYSPTLFINSPGFGDNK